MEWAGAHGARAVRVIRGRIPNGRESTSALKAVSAVSGLGFFWTERKPTLPPRAVRAVRAVSLP